MDHRCVQSTKEQVQRHFISKPVNVNSFVEVLRYFSASLTLLLFPG